DLPHRESTPAEPLAVQLAELGVAVAVVAVLGEVLEVEQLERHARTSVLAMELLEVGQHVLALGLGTLAQHPQLELVMAGPIEVGELELGPGREREHLGHRAHAAADAGDDLLVRASEAPLLAQDLSDAVHGQSRRSHRAPKGAAAAPARP